MVRNALADPFVLGISSGAAVGANAVILLGAVRRARDLGAVRVRLRSRRSPPWRWCTPWPAAPHGLTPLRLVLTGTALAYGFEAVTTVMVFGAARGEAARSALMWLLGSLGGATWAQVPIVAATVAAGWAWLRPAGRVAQRARHGRRDRGRARRPAASGCAGSCSSSPPP